MKPRILALLLALLLLCGCAAPQKAPWPSSPHRSSLRAIVTWDSLTFDRAAPLLRRAVHGFLRGRGLYAHHHRRGSDVSARGRVRGPGGRAGGRDRPAAAAGPYSYLSPRRRWTFFRELDAVDRIALSGQKESDWYIDEAKAAMQAGTMVYAGKYSAPDYETILVTAAILRSKTP